MKIAKLRNGNLATVSGKSPLGRLLMGNDQEGNLLIWNPDMKTYRWDFDEEKPETHHDLDIMSVDEE